MKSAVNNPGQTFTRQIKSELLTKKHAWIRIRGKDWGFRGLPGKNLSFMFFVQAKAVTGAGICTGADRLRQAWAITIALIRWRF